MVYVAKYKVVLEHKGEKRPVMMYYVAENDAQARTDMRDFYKSKPSFELVSVERLSFENIPGKNETKRITEKEYEDLRKPTPAHMTPHLTNTPMNPYARSFHPPPRDVVKGLPEDLY